ncbi:hypothetical protein LO771_19850 [Streptacidiphilus sp. ASG 303]|uniref:hypothetical protein n=1 Tax=Streptacidiphilus sp. ASG 303 TaxID=2896847 RepID=UPI001E5C6BD7|nr:hypothetical protein [Streptacidiphilus sp. ASG 303]MCD0484587.1 hypothetical protein [Streptacidiphilus sp. ASG 303]
MKIIDHGADLGGQFTGTRNLLASVLNRFLGLPACTDQSTHPDVDEPPADDEVIVEDTAAPAHARSTASKSTRSTTAGVSMAPTTPRPRP